MLGTDRRTSGSTAAPTAVHPGASIHRLLGRYRLLPVEGLADYEAAADLYRRCRAGGETVRRLTGCLIATVALRHGSALLHRDHDFEVLARHTPLRLAE